MKTPAVLINRHRQTAIRFAAGPKFVHVVAMAGGLLTTSQIPQTEIRSEGWREIEYPLERAVEVYLNHLGGISDAARRELEALK